MTPNTGSHQSSRSTSVCAGNLVSNRGSLIQRDARPPIRLWIEFRCPKEREFRSQHVDWEAALADEVVPNLGIGMVRHGLHSAHCRALVGMVRSTSATTWSGGTPQADLESLDLARHVQRLFPFRSGFFVAQAQPWLQFLL